jgi:hypothetical protein
MQQRGDDPRLLHAYYVVNRVSGQTVARFDSVEEARAALRRFMDVAGPEETRRLYAINYRQLSIQY